MIRCADLMKVYQARGGEVRSLDAISLDVKSGEFVVVRGGSGSGKTTLLLSIGGMLRPSSGRIEFQGKDLYRLSSRERASLRASEVGFVFQMFHLVPYLTVLDNVLLAAKASPDAATRRRAIALIEGLGLLPRIRHRPSQLSAGERQRTAIARALLNQPKMVLADEPTGNLDPDNEQDVFRRLSLFHKSGGTVMVVTHGSTAESFADRVIHLKAGRIDSEHRPAAAKGSGRPAC